MLYDHFLFQFPSAYSPLISQPFFLHLREVILRKAELAIFIMISKHLIFQGVDICVQEYKQCL